MKKLLLFILCVFLNINWSLAEMRTWTSMNGSTLEAEFQRVSAGSAVLKKTDGKVIRFPIRRLSKQDRDFIKSLSQKNPLVEPVKKLSAEFEELLAGEKLINVKGEEVSYSELAGKYIGVYFGAASWCHASIEFTPEFVKARKRMVSRGYNFEVLYVSLDKSEENMFDAMKDYKMKWPAVPYMKEAYRNFRLNGPDIKGTPEVHIYNPDGKLISATGWPDVEEDGPDAFEHWQKIDKNNNPDAAK